MESAVDIRSPELAYATKDNILVPKTDARTAAQVAAQAAQDSELNRTKKPSTVGRATNVLTETLATRKEV